MIGKRFSSGAGVFRGTHHFHPVAPPSPPESSLLIAEGQREGVVSPLLPICLARKWNTSLLCIFHWLKSQWPVLTAQEAGKCSLLVNRRRRRSRRPVPHPASASDHYKHPLRIIWPPNRLSPLSRQRDLLKVWMMLCCVPVQNPSDLDSWHGLSLWSHLLLLHLSLHSTPQVFLLFPEHAGVTITWSLCTGCPLGLW